MPWHLDGEPLLTWGEVEAFADDMKARDRAVRDANRKSARPRRR